MLLLCVLSEQRGLQTKGEASFPEIFTWTLTSVWDPGHFESQF